jgi:hypothetical protein
MAVLEAIMKNTTTETDERRKNTTLSNRYLCVISTADSVKV